MRNRHATSMLSLCAALLAGPFAAGADDACGTGGGEDAAACDDAKQHVCDNIEGQGCSTESMGDAVDKVKEACGSAEADAFVPKVEEACARNGLEECTTL